MGGVSADPALTKPMTPTGSGGPSPSPDPNVLSSTHHSASVPSRTFPTRLAAPQGGGHSLKLGSPSAHGSPGVTSATQGAVTSPRHRQSRSASASPGLLPQHPPAALSPAASLHSPASAVCSSSSSSSTSGSQAFSSLGALQALSQGHAGQHPASPERKPAGLQSPPHSSSSPGAQVAKSHCGLEDDLFRTFGEQQQELLLPSQHQEGEPDEERDEGDTPAGFLADKSLAELGDSANRLLNAKGHRKLLQLLTTKMEPPDPCSPSRGDEQDCKDPLTGMGALGGTGANNHSTSLKEKHKILHRLLQTSTSPVELAKLTAEATGKDPGEQEAAPGDAAVATALGELSAKQEPGSPKKKDNALLRYLLDRDDNSILDKAIKMEPGDGAKLSSVKVEKQEAGFNLADQVSSRRCNLCSSGRQLPLFEEAQTVSETQQFALLRQSWRRSA